MRRLGWTLHEMLISLGVLGGVVALTSHLAAGQLRFFRGLREVAAVKGQTVQASTIAAGIMWAVSSSGDDVVAAQDSAIEIHLPLGSAFSCGSAPGRLTMAAPSAARGNALAAFIEYPEAGDRILALFEDSLGATWLTLHVASPPTAGGSCPQFTGVTSVWSVGLIEQVIVPAGAALRFTRPFRLSLYRASDGRWYLGAKDWNHASQRFNTIQPVAGPLKPYSDNAGQTGLLFVYRDLEGVELAFPPHPRRIGSVTVVSRGATAHFEDSTVVVAGLRNAR